jgi:hypothetical protein
MALIFSVSVQADASERLIGTTEARQLTDNMMTKIAAGEVEAGLSLAKPYLIIPDAEFKEMVSQTNLQMPKLGQRFGKSVGSEFIREDKVGTSFYRIIQVQRFEKHITRWTFYFYKTPTGWVLNTFNFDDKIQLLFDAGG